METGRERLWHGRCNVAGTMNTDTPERDTLAFIEALAGEYAGTTPASRSCRRPSRDPSQELVAAFATEIRALVA